MSCSKKSGFGRCFCCGHARIVRKSDNKCGTCVYLCGHSHKVTKLEKKMLKDMETWLV